MLCPSPTSSQPRAYGVDPGYLADLLSAASIRCENKPAPTGGMPGLRRQTPALGAPDPALPWARTSTPEWGGVIAGAALLGRFSERETSEDRSDRARELDVRV